MKTIEDAYEALDGDLNNSFGRRVEQLFLFFNVEMGHYICDSNRGTSRGKYQYICTVEEFNNYKGEEMKDVIDAVIEFKGEWVDAGWTERTGDYHTINQCIQFTDEIPEAFVGSLRVGGNQVDEDYFTVICDKKQFNACVDWLSSNKGRATQTYAEYKKDFDSVAVMINWDSAPDNALHLAAMEIGNVGINYWLSDTGYYVHGDYYEFGLEHDGGEYFAVNEFKIIESRPQFKPAYTQAMADNNELPVVDMECSFSIKGGLWQDVVVNYLGTNIIVLTSQYNGAQFSSRIDESRFKAIDQRTDKEKAIDDINGKDWASFGDLIEKIQANEIRGVKWVGK